MFGMFKKKVVKVDAFVGPTVSTATLRARESAEKDRQHKEWAENHKKLQRSNVDKMEALGYNVSYLRALIG